MNVDIAGAVVTPISPTKCKLVQIIDVDLNGSIPQFVVELVTCRAFPQTMRRIERIARGLGKRDESLVLLASKDATEDIDVQDDADRVMEADRGVFGRVGEFVQELQPWLVAGMFLWGVLGNLKKKAG